MAKNNYTTPEMSWDNLMNTYLFLKRQDTITADAKISDYLTQEINKAVDTGFSTRDELIKRLKTNLIYDKRKRADYKDDEGKHEEATLFRHLIRLFEAVLGMKAGKTVITASDKRCRESTVDLNGIEKKAFWKYTVDELKQIDGDLSFYQSVVEGIRTALDRYQLSCENYYGPDWRDIIMDAKEYALWMYNNLKKGFINGNPPVPKYQSKMTLEEKIAKGIAVVITPDVIAELAKMYPNIGAESTEPVEYTEEDAAALEAEKKAIEEAKAKAAEEEAKAKADAKAERERLAAEAAEAAKAKAEEKAKAEAEKPKAKEATAPTIPVDEEYMQTLKRVNNRNMILDTLRQRKEAKAREEAEAKIEAETKAKVKATTVNRAMELANIIKSTDDMMIHAYELEVDWEDIDETLEAIIEMYPDNFEYDEETDEILYYANEEC